jgi:hypothetical protein
VNDQIAENRVAAAAPDPIPMGQKPYSARLGIGAGSVSNSGNFGNQAWNVRNPCHEMPSYLGNLRQILLNR